MLELIGGAAPESYGAPTAVGLDSRVEAGLDFAQMLRQAEKEQSPPVETSDEVRGMPEQEDTRAEIAVAEEDDPREEAVEEEGEEDVTEDVTTAPERAEAVVAVVMELAPEPESEGEGEGGDEGEDEDEFVAPVRFAAAAGEEEAPLETDVEMEGDGEAVPQALAPIAEVDVESPLELLNFSELMDPDLVVEKTPDQLIARITQAASATTPQLQEELAETVMPQVIRSLATLVRAGGAEMRLQLKPADLGEIELRVRTAEGVVRGEMMVQHPEVKQLLEDQVARLKEALAAQGLELEGFDVSVDRDPRFAQADRQRRQGGRQQRSAAISDVGDERQAPVAVSVGDHAVDFTT